MGIPIDLEISFVRILDAKILIQNEGIKCNLAVPTLSPYLRACSRHNLLGDRR